MTPQQDIVLVHGWGMNAAVWRQIDQHLRASYRVHLMELPGHGDRAYRGQHGLEEWVEDCLEQAPVKAHWIGWSLGGLLASGAALMRPERVLSLTLTASAPRFIQGPQWPNAMAVGTLATFHDNLNSDYAGTLQRFLALQVRGSDHGRDTLRLLKMEMHSKPQAQTAALQEGLRLLRETDLCGQITHLSMPTLWLFGERDSLIPNTVIQDLLPLLPAAGVINTIAGAAHAPFLSHPGPWLERVQGHLSCLR